MSKLSFIISLFVSTVGCAQNPISKDELVAPEVSLKDEVLVFRVSPSVEGRSYQLQTSLDLEPGSWRNLGAASVGNGSTVQISTSLEGESKVRFYRLQLNPLANIPEGFSLIPEGSFLMGDNMGDTFYPEQRLQEEPVHEVITDAFYLQSHETTKALWDKVYFWAIANDYAFDKAGDGKAEDHPVHSVNWYDAIRWCNARSEMEGLIPCYYSNPGMTEVYRSGHLALQNEAVKWSSGGYRLPTEAEWEKAARGGLPRKRFPWGDSIQHDKACYQSDPSFKLPYDMGWGTQWDPALNHGAMPYTAPVGSYESNGYNVFDMAGGVAEWCWDSFKWGDGYYTVSPLVNPRGPQPEPNPPPGFANARMHRDGGWHHTAYFLRCSQRGGYSPTNWTIGLGFRTVRAR